MHLLRIRLKCTPDGYAASAMLQKRQRETLCRFQFSLGPEGRQRKHSTPRPVNSKPGTRLDFTQSLRMASVAAPTLRVPTT